jgi:hypothetical protein
VAPCLRLLMATLRCSRTQRDRDVAGAVLSMRQLAGLASALAPSVCGAGGAGAEGAGSRGPQAPGGGGLGAGAARLLLEAVLLSGPGGGGGVARAFPDGLADVAAWAVQTAAASLPAR